MSSYHVQKEANYFVRKIIDANSPFIKEKSCKLFDQ